MILKLLESIMIGLGIAIIAVSAYALVLIGYTMSALDKHIKSGK